MYSILFFHLLTFGGIAANSKPPTQRMLDFILAVDRPRDWHAQNLLSNPGHYSFPIRLLGASAAATVQQSRFGARVYFNTLLAPGAGISRSFKYGVIALADLERDLRGWDSLYVAGRMQKPIRVLSPDALPAAISEAAADNISAAASAALLTLPARFKETDLYHAAAGLSYSGDVRMTMRAEVAEKVPNIVRANITRFRGLYKAAVSDSGVDVHQADGIWERNIGTDSQHLLLQRLPFRVLSGAGRVFGAPDGHSREALVADLAKRDASQLRNALLATIAVIVSRSSLRQSIKGIVTVGLGTSVRYVAAKVQKAMSARPRVASGTKTSRQRGVTASH
jgi:mitochondrial translocator assembly and maintenance protein 41